jgi:hypothetical protein
LSIECYKQFKTQVGLPKGKCATKVKIPELEAFRHAGPLGDKADRYGELSHDFTAGELALALKMWPKGERKFLEASVNEMLGLESGDSLREREASAERMITILSKIATGK